VHLVEQDHRSTAGAAGVERQCFKDGVEAKVVGIRAGEDGRGRGERLAGFSLADLLERLTDLLGGRSSARESAQRATWSPGSRAGGLRLTGDLTR